MSTKVGIVGSGIVGQTLANGFIIRFALQLPPYNPRELALTPGTRLGPMKSSPRSACVARVSAHRRCSGFAL
jgi:hypothetical protein